MRVKANHIYRIRNKIGERVYIVIVNLTVAVINDVFNTPNINFAFLNNGFYVFDDLVRRGKCFHLEAIFRRIYSAGITYQVLPGCGLAYIGRTKVEGITGNINTYSIKVFSA